MKGLIWDDLGLPRSDEDGEGDILLEAREQANIDRLKAAFLRRGVTLISETNWERVNELLLTGDFSFAIFDIFAGDEPIGLQHAQSTRRLMREDPDIQDPYFPIFLMSRELDRVRATEIVESRFTTFPKNWPKDDVVSGILNTLLPTGRWTADGQVLLLGGSETDAGHAAIRSFLKSRGWTPKALVPQQDPFFRDLKDLRNGILRAEHIICTVGRAAELLKDQRTDSHLDMPETYLEMGIVASVSGTLQKLVVIAEADAIVPSFLSPAKVLRYSESIDTALGNLGRLFPERHPQAAHVAV